MDTVRIALILKLCRDFTSRYDDDGLNSHCDVIIEALDRQFDSPLQKDDHILSSAAITYLACQKMKLIRKGRGISPLGEEIAAFYKVKESTLRHKVETYARILDEDPDYEWLSR